MKKMGSILLIILFITAMTLTICLSISTRNISNLPPSIDKKGINISYLANYISSNGQIWIHAKPENSKYVIENTFSNWFSDQYLSIVGSDAEPIVEGVDYTVSGDFTYPDDLDNPEVNESVSNLQVREATITSLDNADRDIELTGNSVSVYYYVSDRLFWNTQNSPLDVEQTITQPSTLFSPSYWGYDKDLNKYIPIIILNENNNNLGNLINRINLSFSKNLVGYNFINNNADVNSSLPNINNLTYTIRDMDGKIYSGQDKLTEGYYDISLLHDLNSADSEIFGISEAWNIWSTMQIKINVVE